MASKIKAGIVGYGKSAKRFHLPILKALDGVKISAIVQRSGGEALEENPGSLIVKSLDELLELDSVELVIITTPNNLHYEHAKKCLEAGKHVIVEKPFTVRFDEADELRKLAESKDLILTVYHNRRWDGDFLSVKKLLEKEDLGRLVEFESNFNRFRNYQRPDSWKEKDTPGSGILYDLGSHLIDQSLQLFGKPDSLFADIRKQRDESLTDDYFQIILGYGSLKVTLNAGMLVPESSPRFVIRGVDGSFIKMGMDPQEDALTNEKSVTDPDWGQEPQSMWGTLMIYENDKMYERSVETEPGRYQDFYLNVFNAIRGDEEIAVKPEEAAEVIRIIERCIESDKKQKVLSLED